MILFGIYHETGKNPYYLAYITKCQHYNIHRIMSFSWEGTAKQHEVLDCKNALSFGKSQKGFYFIQ